MTVESNYDKSLPDPLYIIEDSSSIIYYVQNSEHRVGEWEGCYERECVVLTKEVLKELLAQFNLCPEKEFIDIIKSRIAKKFYKLSESVLESKSFEDLKDIIKKHSQDTLALNNLFKDLYNDVVDTIQLNKAFTIRTIIEEMPNVTNVETAKTKVMRTIRILQRYNILNSYVLQKPYINNIRKTAIFFLCNAEIDDLANVIAQQVNVDRGFGYSTTGTDKVIEHNKRISEESQKNAQEREEAEIKKQLVTFRCSKCGNERECLDTDSYPGCKKCKIAMRRVE